MSKKISQQIKFNFHYLNQSGKQKGFLASSATVNKKEILLKKQALNYDAILESNCRDKRLILNLDLQKVNNPKIAEHLIEQDLLVLEIHNKNPKKIKLFIDRICSQTRARKRQAQLMFEGKRQDLRQVTCPKCEATIDLSLLNKTPYIYCEFCESIFQEEGSLLTAGDKYRLCDECHWFDRVQGYTEFYFYFLILIYGYSWERRYLCDSCVNRVFWKMLLINFIFILGIIPALWIKIKSLIGRDKNLQELAKANAFCKEGKQPQANVIYSRLYKNYPKHPGLLLNQSFGHLYREDKQVAGSLLEESLQHCSNYAPALKMLNHLQEQSS